jgi:hypothetical protein
MKKQDQVELSVDGIFPMDVRIKGIKSVNYNFDFEKLEPWSSDVVVHDDEYRTITIYASKIVPAKGHVNEQFKHLIENERQLLEDFHTHMVDYYDHVGAIEQLDRPLEEMLQRCAIFINSAKCAEDLGFKVHGFLKMTDKDLADNQLKIIYQEYAIQCYSMALGVLTVIGEKRVSEISNKNKFLWARMLAYAQNKSISTMALYSSDSAIKYCKNFCKRSSKLLIENGFVNLVTDYTVENVQKDVQVCNSTSIFGGAKQLILSAFNIFYDSDRSAAGEYHISPKPKEYKSTDSLMLPGDNEEQKNVGEQELRRRKINSSSNKL